MTTFDEVFTQRYAQMIGDGLPSLEGRCNRCSKRTCFIYQLTEDYCGCFDELLVPVAEVRPGDSFSIGNASEIHSPHRVDVMGEVAILWCTDDVYNDYGIAYPVTEEVLVKRRPQR